MDPEGLISQVLLLLRLLSDAHPLGDKDREMIDKWELQETRVASARDTLMKIQSEIFLLEKAKAVSNLSPSLLDNLDEEITRKKDKWGNDWILDLFRGIIFKKMKEIEALEMAARATAEEVMRQLEAARTTSNDDKLRIEGLHNQLAEKSRAIDTLETRVRTLASTLKSQSTVMARKLRKKDSEMAIKLSKKQSELVKNLREKDSEVARKLGKKVDLLLQLNRKKEDADTIQPEEAQRLDCEALRLRALQAEELNASLSTETRRAHRVQCDALRVRALQAEQLHSELSKETESLRMALQDKETKCNHLEKELSDTRLRSGLPETQLRRRVLVRGQNIDTVTSRIDKHCDLSRVKLETSSRIERGRDNPQIKTGQNKQDNGIKRMRDSEQHVVRTRSLIRI